MIFVLFSSYGTTARYSACCPYKASEYIEVTWSSDSTAMVVRARNGEVLLPSGMRALPYWNRAMGQRSFSCQKRVPVGGGELGLRRQTRTCRSRLTSLGSTMVEKKISQRPHAASVDGGTGDRCELRATNPLTVEAVDEIRFQEACRKKK